MTHVILVHGMNATADSWNTIPNALETVADSVTAIQLPGHDKQLPGHDKPLNIWDLLLSGTYNAGFGMEGYVDAVTEAFPTTSNRDVCLIGHSMGGAVISHVAAKHPERIAGLVYVTAMLPDQGQSVADLIDESRNDSTFDEIEFLADFTPYLKVMKLVQQPKEPLATPFTRTAEFEALTQNYVRCINDDVIPVAVQDRMLEAYSQGNPKMKIRSLDSGHLPQYEVAYELGEALKDLIP